MYPGPTHPDRKWAWFPLFAHAHNLPKILVNRGLPCYFCITLTSHRILLRSTIAHSYEKYSTEMEFNFDRALSYALQRLGSPGMKLTPEQEAAVSTVYNGRDVFVWLPTGFVKSLCYEVLPFLMDCKLGRVAGESQQCRAICSTVLVISPLISLMVDQVLSLRRRGVDAAIITS